MLKRDFLSASNNLVNKLDSAVTARDDIEKLKWLGAALGLIRAVRPELPGSLRDRNHPYQPENNLNLSTFIQDVYIALLEMVSYVETLPGDDCTV